MDTNEVVTEVTKVGISTVGELLKTMMINSRENYQYKKQQNLEEFKIKIQKGVITKKDLLGLKNGINNIDTLQRMGEKLYSNDILVTDLENVLKKCENENISVSVVADTNSVDKVQVVCLDGDKEQMEKIALSVMEEKDKYIYSMFEIKETAIDSMSILSEKNNITVNFFKNDDDKTYCQYLKSEEGMVDNLHQQVLDAQKKVENINTYISYNENLPERFQFVIEDTDKQVAKKIDFCDKSQLIDALQENLSYDELTANEVANKLYDDFSNKVENLNKTNIAKIENLNKDLLSLKEEVDFSIPDYKDMDNCLSEFNNRIDNIEYMLNQGDIDKIQEDSLVAEKYNLISAINIISKQQSIVNDNIKFNQEKLNAFVVDTRQKQLFKRFETNISVVGETSAIKDYQFSRAVYKEDNEEQILINDTNTNKSLSYRVPIDRIMLENDLKERLGISDKLVLSSMMNKCEQLGYVEKSKFINIDKEYSIQADLSNQVTVSLGNKSVKCDLIDISNAKKTLQREFGMSEKKADKIIEKAKKQNPQLDAVRNRMKIAKSSPLVNKKQKRGSI